MAVTLGSMAVGSIVKLKENGTLQNYIVVHQGNPSTSIYDNSCNGTWLLRQEIVTKLEWQTWLDNKLESSNIQSWLNSTMLSKYDTDIQNAIKQVKISYRKNGGSGGTNQTGANGLSCKIFLLSGYEVGWTTNDISYIPVDGAKLDYFEAGTSKSANNKRRTPNNEIWWLRSPRIDSNKFAIEVEADGSWSAPYVHMEFGVRPALILPTNLLVNGDSSIFINTAPTTPASINIPSTIYGGNNIDITWGVSTDIDGNLSGYKLEKSVNGGSSWSQIYQGSAINTTDHVSYGTTTVMYRVKAYDALGLESGYKTSNNITVINNTAPTIPSSIMVPDVIIGGKTLNISWGASTDTQGDIIKYQLERSINSGGSYTKIYDGTNLSYIDTINIAWTKVLYRVRAYDTLMAYSAYKSSTDKNVLNLSIASINVPSIAMQGQQIPINWFAAPNADSYTLERNADNSTWESIYTGSDTSYTDTATSWNTVKYRVKASNNGNWGDYKTSTAIPVVSTSALVISGEDSDLGTLTNNVPYTVSTDTENTISVERYVNGQLVAKINVNSGFSYTIPVIDLPTGTGTIKLVATVQTLSGSPVSKTRIWTYNKTPVNFPDNGGVGALTQDGNNIFPPTLAECVRVAAQFGGSLDKALELISPLLNMAVMAVGSYIGSGTFGQDSPNSLTFDFSPQMVIISGGNKSLTISNTIKTDGGTVGYIEGTKVTWYNSLGADEQLNQSEITYTYIAVGKQVQT